MADQPFNGRAPVLDDVAGSGFIAQSCASDERVVDVFVMAVARIEHGGNAALRRYGVRPGREHLGDTSRLQARRRHSQRSAKPRAASANDIPDPALAEYIRVMGFSVDFQREIRRGDAFELLYEQQIDQITGDVIGTELHYAGLMLSGKQLGFYRYDHDGSRVGWYDRDGNSAARTLIRTPISGARLSSSYGMRKHPISGYNKMHKGVDFAAPSGTPIIAAGSGVITKSGWLGAYGRYVSIRHNGTYSTAYAHMSRIARGITPGARVEQGQIIGYVGSSGRSTGPHLHYEILVNNRKVNPLTVSLPTGEKIPPELLAPFKKRVELVEAEVMATGSLHFAGMELLPSELASN